MSSQAVTFIFVMLFGYLVSREFDQSASVRNGRAWVEYGPISKTLPIGLFLLSLVFMYAVTQASSEDSVLLIGTGLFFGLFGVVMGLTFFFTRISFDEGYIYLDTLRRATKQIPWSSVERVHRASLGQNYVVITNGYGKITISAAMSGHKSLVEEIRKKISIQHASQNPHQQP